MLRGICKLRKRKMKTSYLVFQVVSKAYDSVWRERLLCKMKIKV